MTRLEFFQSVIEHLARATDMRLRSMCLCLLERQVRIAHLKDVLLPRDIFLIGVAVTQCELTATGRTYLHKNPLPGNPMEAALYFLSVSERVRTATGRTCWMLIMWAAIAPFKHQRPQWGSA